MRDKRVLLRTTERDTRHKCSVARRPRFGSARTSLVTRAVRAGGAPIARAQMRERRRARAVRRPRQQARRTTGAL